MDALLVAALGLALVAARLLAARAKKVQQHNEKIIDAAERLAVARKCPWMTLGWKGPSPSWWPWTRITSVQLQRDLPPADARVLTKVTGIRPRTVYTSGGTEYPVAVRR